MPIRYYLQPNPGPLAPHTHFACVATVGNLHVEDLAQEMARRGAFPNAAAAQGSIQTFLALVAEKVAAGYAINTPLCTIRPTIQGTFTGLSDGFDPARHDLMAALRTGPLLRREIRSASVQKTRQPTPAPVLIAVINQNTGAHNATLTPGGLGQARGLHLKYGPRPNEGIYLVNPATGEETRVQTVGKKTKSELLFLCPLLAPGAYRLEVRRAAANGSLRDGHLNELLTVA